MVTKRSATKPARTTAERPTAKTSSRAQRKTGEYGVEAEQSGKTAAKAMKSAASRAGSAAMGAAADLTELVAEASHNTLAINPLIGLNRADVASAAKSLLKVVSKAPAKTAKHCGHYLKELTSVVKGKSALAPDPKDRRFADAAWQSNWFYARLMLAYVATQKELNSIIDGSSLGTIDKGRAQFFASLVIDALAPSNFVLGNPAAVRKIVDTGGENLIKGLKNLVHDVRNNNMMPSQVDASPFRLGENIATSHGQVVHRHEMFELIQYTPSTPQVHQRPLVVFQSQVNKFYALDLSPEKSVVKWVVDSGVPLFVVSWCNPTIEHRHWGLEAYCQAMDTAVDVARQVSGSPDVNVWGACSGGMTLAAYLGWLAARGDKKVANSTWVVCVLDTKAAIEDSMLGLFNSPATVRAAKARSRRKGLVHGNEMASMFAWLRPNDLIWNYWVNNYLLGNKPPAFDILAWNADTTRLPGQFHCDLLDMVESNPYVNAGTLEIAGEKIDFSKVKLDAYVVGGITDHITPWRACYSTARLFGEGTTFVLANAGHLQSILNPPGTPKSFFFAAPACGEDPLEWARQAQPTKQDGSWWVHWRGWLKSRSGDLVDAPKKLGSRKHKPICPAPGEYVLVK